MISKDKKYRTRDAIFCPFRFGRLTIQREVERVRSGRRVECVCDCGTKKVVLIWSLRMGHTRSCGCLAKEILSTRSYVDGRSRGNSNVYNIWLGIKKRCNKPTHESYPDYGGRGIMICDRWMSFENFVKDMGVRPSSNYSIERINNDLGYYPGNCRWATMADQNRNNRRNVWHNYLGERLVRSDFAGRLGINKGRVLYWAKKGLSDEQMIEKFSKPRGRGINKT